jgi:hypothetical protein
VEIEDGVRFGCRNGATCEMISREGFEVIGVDPSSSGIEQ